MRHSQVTGTTSLADTPASNGSVRSACISRFLTSPNWLSSKKMMLSTLIGLSRLTSGAAMPSGIFTVAPMSSVMMIGCWKMR